MKTVPNFFRIVFLFLVNLADFNNVSACQMIGCAECRWFFVGEIACALRDNTQAIVYVSHAIDGECFGCDAGEMVCGTDPPEDVGEFDCIIRFC